MKINDNKINSYPNILEDKKVSKIDKSSQKEDNTNLKTSLLEKKEVFEKSLYDDKKEINNSKIVNSSEKDNFIDEFFENESVQNIKEFSEKTVHNVNKGLDFLKSYSGMVESVSGNIEKAVGTIAKPLKILETTIKPLQLIPGIGDVFEIVGGISKTIGGVYKSILGVKQGAECINKGVTLLKDFLQGALKTSNDLEVNLKKYFNFAEDIFKGKGGINEGIELLKSSFTELKEYSNNLGINAKTIKKDLDVALLGAGSAVNTVSGAVEIAFGIEKTASGIIQSVEKLALIIGEAEVAGVTVAAGGQVAAAAVVL